MLSINLADPKVARMLRGDASVAAGKPRALVQLAGDVPDPTGITMQRGQMSVTRLTAGKQEVLVLYRDMIMTVDVYVMPGEPMKVHLYCPRCHKHSTVPGDRKAIDFDPTAPNPMRTDLLAAGTLPPEVCGVAYFGRLSIEAFECPWEIGEDRHASGAVHTGATLCRQRLVIDDNRARDA